MGRRYISSLPYIPLTVEILYVRSNALYALLQLGRVGNLFVTSHGIFTNNFGSKMPAALVPLVTHPSKSLRYNNRTTVYILIYFI
jgi:hypothetical protein